jgi:ribose transport system permease protein
MSGGQSLNYTIEKNKQLIVPVVLVMALCVLSLVCGPHLFTNNGIGSAIIVLSPMILAALALTPIALVGRGGVDLSVGPLLGFINVSMVKWLVGNEITNPVLIVGYVIAAGVIYQLIVATIIIYVRVAPIIVTLSGYLVLTGVNLVIMDRPSGVAPDWMQDWGSGTDILSPVFLIVVIMIALWIVFSKTSLYRQILLTGAEERMSFANGVNTVASRYGAHIVSGVFTGIAALTYTALISSGDPTQGNTYTLAAITALVLGGTSLAGGKGGGFGSILGAVNIYLISYVLSTFSFGSVSGFVTQMSTGTILVISLIINSFMNRRSA